MVFRTKGGLHGVQWMFVREWSDWAGSLVHRREWQPWAQLQRSAGRFQADGLPDCWSGGCSFSEES